jgi:hypothetical protein
MGRTAIAAALILSGCLVAGPAGCATGRERRPAPAAAPPARTQDDVDERLAAQRAANPLLHSEDNERRFGLERARQRKRLQQQQKATQKKTAPGSGDVVKSKNDKPTAPAPPP